jgi:hypothetical protein
MSTLDDLGLPPEYVELLKEGEVAHGELDTVWPDRYKDWPSVRRALDRLTSAGQAVEAYRKDNEM